MVCDNHYISHLKLFVHTSGCIADKQCLHSYLLHYSYRESHLFHVVSLIVMETSLHCHDIFASEISEYKFS